MMTKDLENKTAIVTAASRGIGLAIAEKLVEQGPLSIWLCGAVKRTVS